MNANNALDSDDGQKNNKTKKRRINEKKRIHVSCTKINICTFTLQCCR